MNVREKAHFRIVEHLNLFSCFENGDRTVCGRSGNKEPGVRYFYA